MRLPPSVSDRSRRCPASHPRNVDVDLAPAIDAMRPRTCRVRCSRLRTVEALHLPLQDDVEAARGRGWERDDDATGAPVALGERGAEVARAVRRAGDRAGAAPGV